MLVLVLSPPSTPSLNPPPRYTVPIFHGRVAIAMPALRHAPRPSVELPRARGRAGAKTESRVLCVQGKLENVHLLKFIFMLFPLAGFKGTPFRYWICFLCAGA